MILAISLHILQNFYSSDNPHGPIRIILVLITVFTILCIGYNIFIYKIGLAYSTSWIDRLEGYLAGFYSWLKSPIFGNGFRDGGKVTKSFLTTGFLNAAPAVLAQGGIVLSLVYWYPMIKVFIVGMKNRDSSIVNVSLMVLCAFIFFTWEYTFLLLMFIAIFMSYSEEDVIEIITHTSQTENITENLL